MVQADQTVHDRIGNGRLAQGLIPLFRRQLARDDDAGCPFNLSNPQKRMFLDLVDMIIRIAGNHYEVIYHPNPAVRSETAQAGYYTCSEEASVMRHK